MTFRTYLPFATAAVVAAVFSIVDGAVSDHPDPPSSTAAVTVVAPAR